MNRSSRHCGTVAAVLIPLALACFALSPQARATCQDACLTNNNTVQGDDALISLTTGTDNTGIGFNALFSNSGGNFNTAIGSTALSQNTTGHANTAIGNGALGSNAIGFFNTATGNSALRFNSTGTRNTATGAGALFFNSTGSSNTATGDAALGNNITGTDNTATGLQALLNTRGSGNIAVGSRAGLNLFTGDNNIAIGNPGLAEESGTIRIGTQGTQTKTFIAGVRNSPVAGAMPVGVTSDGQLGVRTSSKRFKEAIEPLDKASEAILALKPVTFHYKQEIDPDGIPQFGLVAEDVEEVNSDLVARDDEGKPYTVRYEAVNAMLLNEFLKEHRRNEAQQKEIEALTAMVKEQATQIQKVSAQIGLSKPAPQTGLNNQ